MDSPLRLKADQELIRETLPRVFQRTHKDLRPVLPGGAAASMDSAEDAAPQLPDVYQVQGNVPGVLLSWYGAHSFIGHQACAILAQHWLIDKACSQAPKDAAQNGFTALPALPGADVQPEVARRIDERNREMGILGQCREFARNARIFGIRHALFLVDGVDYAAPFNADGVRPGSYRGISQIDPYWLAPEFDQAGIGDPAAAHFYEPTWWRLPGGQRVHRSHFVILRESDVPDVLKPTYYYGGLPLPQQIYERVYAAERVANEAPELALTKRLITMRGQIENYISDEHEMTERFTAFQRIRSNHGFLIIGEDENVQQLDTALTDFDALIMTQYQLVAAIARTPATKLLGTSPKGFNATGEHESDSYDQELVSIQAHSMTPLLDRHHLLLCRSEFSAYPGLTVSVSWNPARAAKPMEKADLELKAAQAAQTRIAAEVTSPEEERARLMSDPAGGFAGLELPEDDGQTALEEILAQGAGGEEDPLKAIGLDETDAKGNEHDEGNGRFVKEAGGGEAGESAENKARELAKLLGPEYTGVKGQAAIDLLLKEKRGYVKGAFTRSDLGDIDLMWGSKKAKIGLEHIIAERQKRKRDPKELLSELTKVIEQGYLGKDANGKPITNGYGRWEIYLDNKVAVITPDIRGNKMIAVLTAYYDD
jgi:phage-related protein (TIGR01555 family)